MKKILRILSSIICAIYLRIRLEFNKGAEGEEFHKLIQNLSLLFLIKLQLRYFCEYFTNPIVLFRLAEFQFVHDHLKFNNTSCLCVSSPRMFSAYLLRTTNAKIMMYNPDTRDLADTRNIFQTFKLKNFQTTNREPTQLNEYDTIYSISVIEHMDPTAKRKFLEYAFCALKKGGSLAITFPVASQNREEYRDTDPYDIGALKDDYTGKFFYQRVYDDTAISETIIDVWDELGGVLQHKLIIGLNSAVNYSQLLVRRKKFGHLARAMEIEYSRKCFTTFKRTDDLSDRGICGLILSKPN